MSVKETFQITKDFLRKPFPLLDDVNSKLFLIIFCAGFSTFFLVFYQPMNLDHWEHDSLIGNYITIWGAGIIGAILLFITQFLIRPATNFTTFTIGTFSVWVCLEFFLLSLLFFYLFSESTIPFLEEYLFVFKHTISLASIPYFLACLLIAVWQLSQKTAELAPSIKTPSAPFHTPIQQIFKDEKGKIILAIKPEQLLFLKSENNYTAIAYLQNGTVEKTLIRNSLKNMEKDVAPFPNMLRIHRSYLINLQHIVSTQRKKGSFEVVLDHIPALTFKVSDTYKGDFLRHFHTK